MTTIEERLDHRMLRLLRLAERNDGSLNFDFPERKPRCDELVRAGLLKVNEDGYTLTTAGQQAIEFNLGLRA